MADYSMNVGQSFQVQVNYSCTDPYGNPISDTVTPTVSGNPTTGNATATYDPTPVATGVNTVLTIATTTETDANVYTILVSGVGAVCGQYTTSSFTLEIDPILSLNRQDLMTVVATGNPTQGGSFDYTPTAVSGTSIASIQFAQGVDSTTNPNTSALSDPPNPSPTGAPSPGGLASIQVGFTMNSLLANNDANNPFEVPTFGMSCYYTTLESDWGNPRTQCRSVRIHGTVYSGAVKNPDGLTGTYCSSFIAEVKLQGSGQLNNGSYIQYDPSTQLITTVSEIDGADGTPVVAGQTVARSKSIIPQKGVLIDLDQIGNGLLANDTGGAIQGYRIDLYNGSGKAVCTGYDNVITVGACQPAQTNCPASTLN